MLHFIWYLILGFLIGFVAQWLMPQFGQHGIIVTTIVGIVGSVIGGYLARLVQKPSAGSPFHLLGFVFSVIGALILLFILSKI
jgi:uncharacterized membrane protein YeaQ/YmgE (transglycosylase-associated protein family)